MTKFERNQPVYVTTPCGIVVDGMISETGPMGRPMPFYPDSTVTKYGNGQMGRTTMGYKCRFPMIDPETLEVRLDARGREIFGIGYIETDHISAK